MGVYEIMGKKTYRQIHTQIHIHNHTHKYTIHIITYRNFETYKLLTTECNLTVKIFSKLSKNKSGISILYLISELFFSNYWDLFKNAFYWMVQWYHDYFVLHKNTKECLQSARILWQIKVKGYHNCVALCKNTMKG